MSPTPLRRRRSLSLAVVAAAAAVTVPTLATAGPASAAPSLRWGSCPADIARPKLQCATVRVPLDYGNPGGRQIDIAVSRLASENPAARRGILFTNPGGPGVSGLTYPADLAAAGLPRSVLDGYDVIGMDPRGVGRSAPVTCDFTEEQQARGAFSSYARTGADVVAESRYARTIAQQCAHTATASLLPYTTTANTARDMDRIRVALGEQKASYLGASYGSYLGAVYTTLFPGRSDRVVLDSNLGPGGYDVTAMRRLALGMQDRFPDFVAFVLAHPEYRLGATATQVRAKFDELATRLDRQPRQGIDGMQFRAFTFSFIYGDFSFPNVAALWHAADTGAPLPLPSDEGVDVDNTMTARLAVVCGDSRWPTSVAYYQNASAVDRTRWPLLGGSTGNINPCAYWPHPQTMESRVQIGDRGPSNVLMVQNERDPGTPLAGAQELRQAFGARAVMVTADAGGHGVYPFTHNACADAATTAFLVTGERPATDLACPEGPSAPAAE